MSTPVRSSMSQTKVVIALSIHTCVQIFFLDKSPQTKKRTSSVTLTKPRSLTLESIDHKTDKDRDASNSPSDGPTMRMKKGRQPALGPDTKIFIIWLENFEDHENFPVGRLTTMQLPIKQYIPMKCIKISCQKHKIGSQVLSSRYRTNYIKTCSFLHAHFSETMKIDENL